MFKWSDEKWETVNLQANYSQNNRVQAIPYMVIPAEKGTFKIYLEADGMHAVKTKGGKADGSWNGIIAYDTGAQGWAVGNYKGCTITNYQTSNDYVQGHPDVKLNGCSFTSNRAVECDWYASFHMECDDDDGAWTLYSPPIQKSSDYNYAVSYANFTDKACEWGAVSISIDEVNDTMVSLETSAIRQEERQRKRALRLALTEQDYVKTQEPKKENFEEAYSLTVKTGDQPRSRESTLKDPDSPPTIPPDNWSINQWLEGGEDKVEGYFNYPEESQEPTEKDFDPPPPTPPPILPSESSVPNTGNLIRAVGHERPGDRQLAHQLLEVKRKMKYEPTVDPKKLAPSMGGSRLSTLTGGFLKSKKVDELRRFMTSEEVKERKRIRDQLGEKAEIAYLNGLHLERREEPGYWEKSWRDR